MIGKHSLRLRSTHLAYDMEFTRNITVIRGDSATGKTTLVDMLTEYLRSGSDTGITLACDCEVEVLTSRNWQRQLSALEDTLVFIDEGNRFITSNDFAEAVKNSSNYYVIITREALDNLPYSVTEIYGIKSSGRYGMLEPVYHTLYRIYENDALLHQNTSMVITEDSNSGHDFFSSLCAEGSVRCVSAGGAARVHGLLREMGNTETILVIADGAAFGSQMERVHLFAEKWHNVWLYLPESFEWLILSSGLLNDSEVTKILQRPFDHIDSAKYVSWERYFTSLIVDKTRDTWLRYSNANFQLDGHTKLVQY